MSCAVTGYVMAFLMSQHKWITLELQQCEQNRTIVEKAVSLDGKEQKFFPIRADGKVFFIIKE